MDHKQELEAAHQQTIERFNALMEAKKDLPDDHKEKLEGSKKEWELAWTRLMEALLVLEQLEI